MKTIKAINRRVHLKLAPFELEQEFRAAHWIHNRLLDFEFEHQRVMDAVAPRLTRVCKLLGKLRYQDRRRERTPEGTWAPRERPELKERLEVLRAVLKQERDDNPAWKAAKGWPLDKVGGAKQARRKPNESDEAFSARAQGALRSRREQYRVDLYPQRQCHWSTWNAVVASVDQAVAAVIKERTKGLPADLRRPKFHEGGLLTLAPGAFRVTFRPDGKCVDLDVRVHGGWVTLATSGRSKLPTLPKDADIRTVQVARRKGGLRWQYTVSITIAATWETSPVGTHIVGIDTGHRQMEDGTVRALAWYGSDGQRGEVRLPQQVLAAADRACELQSKADVAYRELQLPHRNRASYLKFLLRRIGPLTKEEQEWVGCQHHHLRAVEHARKRAINLRKEVYRQAVAGLRTRYGAMGIDVVGKSVQQVQTDEMVRHSVRRARGLVAAYSFKLLCEQSGIVDLKATARNSTRECPLCGQLHDNTKDLMILCPVKNVRHDQDYSAAYTMMARAVVAARNLADSLA